MQSLRQAPVPYSCSPDVGLHLCNTVGNELSRCCAERNCDMVTGLTAAGQEDTDTEGPGAKDSQAESKALETQGSPQAP